MADRRFVRIHGEGTLTTTEIWMDTKTGVNYLFHQSGYGRGLTVLLDRGRQAGGFSTAGEGRKVKKTPPVQPNRRRFYESFLRMRNFCPHCPEIEACAYAHTLHKCFSADPSGGTCAESFCKA